MSIELNVSVGQHRPTVIGSVQLDEPCDVCEATGYRLDREFRNGNLFAPVVVDCARCKGDGLVLTADGHDLLNFIKRNTKEEAT